MRRALIVVVVVLVGFVLTGVAGAIGPGIAQEETLVFAEHTVKGRAIDQVAGEFAPGDGYLFRSKLTDPGTGTKAGRPFVHCLVQFAHRDLCEQVYEVAGRGTIVATGMVPVSQLEPGGTWTYAVLGARATSRTSVGRWRSRS